jgi:hypothetical protein
MKSLKDRSAHCQSDQHSTMLFSCDLVGEARKHVAFLKALHGLGVSLKSPSKETINRYVNFWLPLVVSAKPSTELIPPDDVAWLWHCHRLAPLDYERFVQDRFRLLLEATPCFCFQSGQTTNLSTNAAIETQATWARLYPDEAFFLSEENYGRDNGSNKDSAALLGSFDLVESAKSQSAFLWQVSDSFYEKQWFLEDGVLRYYNFLKLPCRSGFSLVPTYQIDLMWHTHILVSSKKYTEDCMRIRGEAFYHDDSLNDRTPGASLDISFQHTSRLWKKAYGIDYVVPHGMYRGEPPLAFFSSMWSPFTSQTSVSEVSTEVSSVISPSQKERNLLWLDPKDRNAERNGRIAFFPPGNLQIPFQKVIDGPIAGYVFGKGSVGTGYYSLDTRDSHQILHKRLKRLEQHYQMAYHQNESNRCLSCGKKQSTKHQLAMKKNLEKAKDFSLMAAVVKAQYEAQGPLAPVSSGVLKKYADKDFNDRVTSSTQVPFPPSIDAAWEAAGCGGGGTGGSACG